MKPSATEFSKFKESDSSSGPTDGSLWELCLFAIFFVIVFSAVARADIEPSVPATPIATTIGAPLAPAKSPTRRFKPSMALVIETTRNLQEDDAVSYAGSYDLTLGLANIYKGWGVVAHEVYAREYSYQNDDGADGAFANPDFAIGKTLKSGEGLASDSFLKAFGFGFSGSLPGSREAQKRTFRGSTGVYVKAEKSIRRLDLAQKFSYSRLYYEYDIRDDGTVNSPDSFKSSTGLSYNVTDKLALSLSLVLGYAINFQGTSTGSQISQLSIDYAFTDAIGTSLGVASEKGTQTPDGQGNRIDLYAPEVAQAFFDLSLTF